MPEIPHDAQVTPAHVLEVIQTGVIPRLDTLEGRFDGLEGTIREAGLNGHTPLLKAFLEQYAGTYQTRQAWQTVRSDVAHRFRFLAQPKAWLRAIFYAVLGGLGWEIASGHLPPHFPHL